MSRVITFSRTFPAYHPKAGEPTYFVEKIYKSILKPTDHVPITGIEESLSLWAIGLADPKHHTIRAGHRWKAGDYFSPRVWSGKPYNSKQITIAPDIQIKKQWTFDLINDKLIINGMFHCKVQQEEKIESFASNDGLSTNDLLDWFKYPKPCTDNQIICWNESIEY